MDHHVTRRILHGLGANAYGQLVVVVTQLAGVPILLHAWGMQLYGEWLILAAIPTYLSMADLGFSQSAGNDMTARIARGDVVGALAVFQSLSAMVYGLALAGLILVALVVAWLPLGSWLHFAALSTREVRWILWLLAAEVLLRLCDGVNHAGFRSHGDYARHVALNASTMLLQNVAAWVAALSGGGPVGAALALVAVRVIEVPAAAAWLRYRHRDVQFGLAHAHARELRRLSKPAFANIAMPIAEAFTNQGMLLAVGAALGAVAVVMFAVTRTLANFLLQMAMLVALPFGPEIATAWGRADMDAIKLLFVRMLSSSFAIVLPASAGIYFLGGFILEVWTHGRVKPNEALMNFFICAAILAGLWKIGIIVLMSANRHLRSAMGYSVSSIALAIVAWLAMKQTHHVDVAGFMVLCMNAGMVLFVSANLRRSLSIDFIEIGREAIKPGSFVFMLRRILRVLPHMDSAGDK